MWRLRIGSSNFCVCLFLLGAVPVFADTVSVSSPGATSAASGQTASFSQKPGSPQFASLNPKPGDSIQVTVTDTCQDSFELAVEDILASSNSPPKGGGAAGAKPPPCSDTDKLSATIVYDSRYSAYVISVRAKAGVNPPVAAASGVFLVPTDFVVYVGTASPWTTDFSGGFTFSKLRNPKYSLTPGTGAMSTTYTIVRDSGAEDSASLGFAGFVTVSRNNWSLPAFLGSPVIGVTFGLGVNTGSRVEYFPGLSLKFGDLIVTAGANIGSIDTLPAGLHQGGTTTQANALSSLPTRTSSGAFIALSYKFLGSSVQQTLQGKISSPTK